MDFEITELKIFFLIKKNKTTKIAIIKNVEWLPILGKLIDKIEAPIIKFTNKIRQYLMFKIAINEIKINKIDNNLFYFKIKLKKEYYNDYIYFYIDVNKSFEQKIIFENPNE